MKTSHGSTVALLGLLMAIGTPLYAQTGGGGGASGGAGAISAGAGPPGTTGGGAGAISAGAGLPGTTGGGAGAVSAGAGPPGTTGGGAAIGATGFGTGVGATGSGVGVGATGNPGVGRAASAFSQGMNRGGFNAGQQFGAGQGQSAFGQGQQGFNQQGFNQQGFNQRRFNESQSRFDQGQNNFYRNLRDSNRQQGFSRPSSFDRGDRSDFTQGVDNQGAFGLGNGNQSSFFDNQPFNNQGFGQGTGGGMGANSNSGFNGASDAGGFSGSDNGFNGDPGDQAFTGSDLQPGSLDSTTDRQGFGSELDRGGDDGSFSGQRFGDDGEGARQSDGPFGIERNDAGGTTRSQTGFNESGRGFQEAGVGPNHRDFGQPNRGFQPSSSDNGRESVNDDFGGQFFPPANGLQPGGGAWGPGGYGFMQQYSGTQQPYVLKTGQRADDAAGAGSGTGGGAGSFAPRQPNEQRSSNFNGSYSRTRL